MQVRTARLRTATQAELTRLVTAEERLVAWIAERETHDQGGKAA